MNRYLGICHTYNKNKLYYHDMKSYKELLNMSKYMDTCLDYCTIIDTKLRMQSSIQMTDFAKYQARFEEAVYLVLVLTKLGYYKDVRKLLFQKCIKKILWTPLESY